MHPVVVRSFARTTSVFCKICTCVTLLGFVSMASVAEASVPGSIAGAFSVDPTGAANYVIPIAVPPGVAGVKPDLRLTYSSRAPDGQLGVGWSMSGLSVVSRCAKTFDQDNISGAVTFDTTDKFCIDGQRVKAMPGNTYGADGSHYRTEKETFKDLVSVRFVGGGPRYFTAHDTAGMTYTYGKVNCLLAASNNACVTWPVTSIVDRYGNSITYTYTIVGSTEYELSEIDYGNSLGINVGKVTFAYATNRPDKFYRYSGNTQLATAGTAEMDVTTRLSSISVFANTTLVRKYTLAYRTSSTGRSLLSSLTQCSDSAGTNCLPPTTFTWSQTPAGFQQGQFPGNTTLPAGAANIQTGDFDGDGITDYIYNNNNQWEVMLGKSILTGGSLVNTGVTINSDRDYPQFSMVGDINGDGCADFIMPETRGAVADWIQYFGDCQGHLTLVDNSEPTHQSENKHPILVDLNGDGILDLVYRRGGDIWFIKGTGAPFDDSASVDTGIAILDSQFLEPMNYFDNGHTQLYVTNDGTGTGGAAVAVVEVAVT